jgi:hypothetical protein
VHNDFSWCQGESPGTLDLVTGFTQPTNLPRIALKKHEMCPRSFIGRTRWGLRLPMSSFGKLIAIFVSGTNQIREEKMSTIT